MPHSVLTFPFSVVPGQLVLLSMWIRDQKGRKTGLSTSADGTLPSWLRAGTKVPRLWFGAFGLQDLPALRQPAQGQIVPATCVLENVHVLFVKDKQEKDCLSLGVTQIGQMESCHLAYKVIHIPPRIQLIFPLTRLQSCVLQQIHLTVTPIHTALC